MRFTIGRSIHKVIVITAIIFLVVGCQSDEFTGNTEEIQGFWKVTALSERPPVPDYVFIKSNEGGYNYHYQGSNLENSRNCYLHEEGTFVDLEGEEGVYMGFNITFFAEEDGSNIIGRNISTPGRQPSTWGDFLLEPVEGLSVSDLTICS